jgi:large subunit ribosomal protein L17
MRHRNSNNHLGRKAGHRKAMMANMAASLIRHKRITTTTAKAKALREYVEPILTRSKEDTTHSRRVVFSMLQDKEAVTELFREVAGKIGDRPGGYTRILKIGARPGDAAEMAIIELVDFNENLLGDSSAATKTSSRRRRKSPAGAKKKSEETAATAPKEEKAVAESAAPEAVEPVVDTAVAEPETSEPAPEQDTDTKQA